MLQFTFICAQLFFVSIAWFKCLSLLSHLGPSIPSEGTHLALQHLLWHTRVQDPLFYPLQRRLWPFLVKCLPFSLVSPHFLWSPLWAFRQKFGSFLLKISSLFWLNQLLNGQIRHLEKKTSFMSDYCCMTLNLKEWKGSWNLLKWEISDDFRCGLCSSRSSLFDWQSPQWSLHCLVENWSELHQLLPEKVGVVIVFLLLLDQASQHIL